MDSRENNDRRLILVVEAKRLVINASGSAYVLICLNNCSLMRPL